MTPTNDQFKTYSEKQAALRKQADEYAANLGFGKDKKSSSGSKGWQTAVMVAVPFLVSFFVFRRLIRKRKKKNKTFLEKLKSEPLIIRLIRQQIMLYFFTFLKGIVLKYVQAYLNKDESEVTEQTEEGPRKG